MSRSDRKKINSHTCGVKNLLVNKSFGNEIEDYNENMSSIDDKVAQKIDFVAFKLKKGQPSAWELMSCL